MIGGRSKIIKRLMKWVESCLFNLVDLKAFSSRPAIIPRRVVRPASCRYLCSDFFRKWPHEIESIRSASIIRISVDICT